MKKGKKVSVIFKDEEYYKLINIKNQDDTDISKLVRKAVREFINKNNK